MGEVAHERTSGGGARRKGRACHKLSRSRATENRGGQQPGSGDRSTQAPTTRVPAPCPKSEGRRHWASARSARHHCRSSADSSARLMSARPAALGRQGAHGLAAKLCPLRSQSLRLKSRRARGLAGTESWTGSSPSLCHDRQHTPPPSAPPSPAPSACFSSANVTLFTRTRVTAQRRAHRRADMVVFCKWRLRAREGARRDGG